MTESSAEMVVSLRERMSNVKEKLIAAQTQQHSAEDQLAAADDAVIRLDLDPERDLSRQVTKLCENATDKVEELEGFVDDLHGIVS